MTIVSTRRSPWQSFLAPREWTEDLFHDIRAIVLGRGDSRQTKHEIVLRAVGKLEIKQPERPAFARILIQRDHIVFRTPAIIDVVIPLGADQPSKGRPKRAASRHKLDFISGIEHLIERDGIPEVAPLYPVPIPRVTLPNFCIPLIALLKPKVSIELADPGAIGMEKGVHRHVSVDGGLGERDGAGASSEYRAGQLGNRKLGFVVPDDRTQPDVGKFLSCDR